MSTHPRGYNTNPMRPGAPLPEDLVELTSPSMPDVSDELMRAEIELMYAIARHRRAWSQARKHKADAEAKSVWAEAYSPYDNAIKDVRWWREEMTAHATAVQALRGMREARTPRPRPSTPPAAASSPPDTRDPWIRVRATMPPAEPGTLRYVVFGWDGTRRPSQREYQAALSWRSIHRSRTDGGQTEVHDALDRLIRAYEEGR